MADAIKKPEAKKPELLEVETRLLVVFDGGRAWVPDKIAEEIGHGYKAVGITTRQRCPHCNHPGILAIRHTTATVNRHYCLNQKCGKEVIFD